MLSMHPEEYRTKTLRLNYYILHYMPVTMQPHQLFYHTKMFSIKKSIAQLCPTAPW